MRLLTDYLSKQWPTHAHSLWRLSHDEDIWTVPNDKSHGLLPKITGSAYRWTFSRDYFCFFVKAGCHTPHAYSNTGWIKDWQIFRPCIYRSYIFIFTQHAALYCSMPQYTATRKLQQIDGLPCSICTDAWCIILPDSEVLRIKQHNTRLTFPFPPELPGWAGTRKVKPIWILLKQETVSGSGISWAICKSAPRSRQMTTPAPHHSVFFIGRMPFLPPNQQRQSTEGTKYSE